MFISIVLNTEYMDIASRSKWYFKNLFHCKKNGWILITHEYMNNHINELKKEIIPSLFDSWEMEPFEYKEVEDVEQYFIPDEIFASIEDNYGSRSEMLFDLLNDDNPKLHACFDSIISEIRIKHPNEKIDGIFNSLESFESINRVANELKVPVINYSFSAIRRPHGYRQTLYFANRDKLWDSTVCEKKWQRFKTEDRAQLPIFTNKEIIALLGKERTLPLLQLMNSTPKYELGICCECFSMLPQVFTYHKYTDDDIFYECKRMYAKDKIKVRSHSIHLDDIQVDRSEVHNDPASFILSCKRLTAVQSQILLKVLLWGRTAVLKKETLAFSYLCSKSYDSISKENIEGLNFLFFGYLIPSDLMFSDEYWKWRLTNPAEVEIYQRHLNFLFAALGLDKEKVLSLQGKDRFKYLLEARGCDKQLVENLLNDEVINNINWDVASSQFDVVTPTGTKSYWRIDTENEDGSLTSKLTVDAEGTIAVKFYPLYDVAGFAKLNAVWINGKEVELDHGMTTFMYIPKNNGCFELPISNQNDSQLVIECNWEYRKVFDYLNS